ncbi:MAG: FecR domain-containing protein [Spirochaetota bacterium]|nr:FecR domain-containing protein [Spirochaetota bacterium]
MRVRIICIILGIMMLFSSMLFAAEGVFTAVTGKVEYRLPGQGWQNAAVGDRVPTGAQISTGFNSRASIELEEAVLRVDALTRMSIDELVEQEGLISTDINLRVGRIQADVRRTEGLRHNFKLRSAQSTAAVRGTSFIYDGINLEVFDGTVRFTNPFDIGRNVSTGDEAIIGEDGLLRSGILDENFMTPFEGASSIKVLEYGNVGGTVTFE